MKRKKPIACMLLAVMTAATLAACSGNSGAEESATTEITLSEEIEEPADEEVTEQEEALPVPAGMYLSELTGEPIDEALKTQRPIAVMVDNELTALDHFATAEADVVYEMMNSTKNDRITRLMCVYKDWKEIPQIGSVRSTRSTNCMLFQEWNAILCHDGGPFYINAFLNNDYSPHFSGFSRVQNGKAYEYTEYVLKGDVEGRLRNTNITENYDENRVQGDHFQFSPYGISVHIEDMEDKQEVKTIDLSGAFWHNSSRLEYNKDTGTYDYYDYGNIHKDAEDDEVLTFKNVILQDVTFSQLDDNGYLVYNILNDTPTKGYYITDGYAMEIYWLKPQTLAHTKYYTYDDAGELQEITINTGKTYIGLIPDDTWDDIKLSK